MTSITYQTLSSILKKSAHRGHKQAKAARQARRLEELQSHVWGYGGYICMDCGISAYGTPSDTCPGRTDPDPIDPRTGLTVSGKKIDHHTGRRTKP